MKNKTITFLIAAYTMFLFQTKSLAGIMDPGQPKNGLRDFREVLNGVLYRGGAANGQKPLTDTQLQAICNQNIRAAYYLYGSSSGERKQVFCENNSMSYQDRFWEKKSDVKYIHDSILDSIRNQQKPVLVHCWHGVHVTGYLSTTALMQFCEMPINKAIEYSKVGVGDMKTWHQRIKPALLKFQRNTDSNYQLSEGEKNRVCPKF
jgi:hypothetical protein